MRKPDIETSGNAAFLPKNKNSLGLIDPICCYGTSFTYILESPKPLINPELPFIPAGVEGYFLYRKEELQPVNEPWEISRVFIDPNYEDPEEKIDVSDVSVIIASDIVKLTAPTLKTFEQLVAKEPLIVDCLKLEK